MTQNHSGSRNRALIVTGLGIALLVAVLLSPLASSSPDGLERVAEDLNFMAQEADNAPAQQLPFAEVFEGYALKGVPEQVATPLAGLIGTLVAFGLAWGFGKIMLRGSGSSSDRSSP